MLKISSGDICPTAVVISGFHIFNTSSPNNNPIPGDFREINYLDLGSATLEHVPEKKGYEGFAKYRHLTLKDNDGAIVIDFPIIADAAADDYVKDINLRITRAKEKAAE